MLEKQECDAEDSELLKDIRIITQLSGLLKMLMFEPRILAALKSGKFSVTFSQRLTPYNRENFRPDQHFIIIDMPGKDNLRLGITYDELQKEAAAKGARIHTLLTNSDSQTMLEHLSNRAVKILLELLAES
jgi:hypothetical protein